MNKELSSRTSGSTGITVLRFPAVKDRVSLSRSAIYAAIKRNAFPPPIKLGERASGWLESEIDAWLAARINATRSGTAA
jgi:prophage regulatory protein